MQGKRHSAGAAVLHVDGKFQPRARQAADFDGDGDVEEADAVGQHRVNNRNGGCTLPQFGRERGRFLDFRIGGRRQRKAADGQRKGVGQCIGGIFDEVVPAVFVHQRQKLTVLAVHRDGERAGRFLDSAFIHESHPSFLSARGGFRRPRPGARIQAFLLTLYFTLFFP